MKIRTEVKFLLARPFYTLAEAAAILSGIHPQSISYGGSKPIVMADWSEHNDVINLATKWIDEEDLDPANKLYIPNPLQKSDADRRTKRFKDMGVTLQAAILGNALDGTQATDNPLAEVNMDTSRKHSWEVTIIRQDALVWWLNKKGLPMGIFAHVPVPLKRPTANGIRHATDPDYLNPDHPFYSKKIAALILAWEHVRDRFSNPNEKFEPDADTPKKAMIKWLIANYDRIPDSKRRLANSTPKRLTDPTKQQTALLNNAEAIAAIANWHFGNSANLDVETKALMDYLSKR